MARSIDSEQSPLPRIWVLRAGRRSASLAERTSNEEFFFIGKKVGLDDPHFVGDLRNLDMKKLKTIVAESDDTLHRSAISSFASNYFRFCNEVEQSDWMLTPSRCTGAIWIGKVSDEYKYHDESRFPHFRSVDWIGNFDKLGLSLSAQRELGAARLFFEFKRNRAEIERIIKSASSARISEQEF